MELFGDIGQVQAHVLIAKSGLKRATVYKSLYTLEAKGLVKQTDITKKLHFAPSSPQTLLELSERQFEKQQRTRDDLRNILPLLTSNYIMSTEKPVVTTYEGVEGLKKIYEDTLVVGQPIDALLQVTEIDPILHQWLETKYVKARIKQQISTRVLVSGTGWTDTFVTRDEKELRTTRRVDQENFPFQHEVNIYGDKIALIHFKKGEGLIGIVINHPLMARTFRAWFELAWLGAERLQVSS
jgi:sugar-specific transcriptional regulator TrmB